MTKYKNFMLVAAFAVAATMLPELSFAIDNVIGNSLCVLQEISNGSAGKAVATLAVLFVGIGAFFGKANWGLVLITALGIALVFGSSAVAGSFGGGTSCA
jgi:type IV secretory pathway VirB2 component (pilin)